MYEPKKKLSKYLLLYYAEKQRFGMTVELIYKFWVNDSFNLTYTMHEIYW